MYDVRMLILIDGVTYNDPDVHPDSKQKTFSKIGIFKLIICFAFVYFY